MFHVRLCQQHDPRHGEQWFGGVSVAQLDACPTQGSSWLGSQQPAPCTLAGAAGTRLRQPRAHGTSWTLPRLPSDLSLAVRTSPLVSWAPGDSAHHSNGRWCKCLQGSLKTRAANVSFCSNTPAARCARSLTDFAHSLLKVAAG